MPYMIFRLVIFSTIIIFAGYYTPKKLCKVPLDLNYIDSTDIIVVAQLSNDQPYPGKGYVCIIKKVFKGKCLGGIVVTDINSKLNFEEANDYLIYANRNSNKASSIFTLSECSRTDLLENAAADIAFLTNKIPCLVERPKNVAGCQRILDPVCGCDGNNYGNECEARIKGINIFSRGRCK